MRKYNDNRVCYIHFIPLLSIPHFSHQYRHLIIKRNLQFVQPSNKCILTLYFILQDLNERTHSFEINLACQEGFKTRQRYMFLCNGRNLYYFRNICIITNICQNRYFWQRKVHGSKNHMNQTRHCTYFVLYGQHKLITYRK